MFPTRVIQPELLDHVAPEIARPNLADLTRINRYFGGHAVIRKMLARVARHNESFTVLDVGAASGDSARVIRELYPAASVTSLDYNLSHLEPAPEPKLVADAFALPFEPDNFDYVLSTLFLHHFTNDQVVDLLRSFYSIARAAILVCDLERHVVPYCFLPATRFLFGWHDITVHDGKISVRAAFRAHELRQASEAAGVMNPEIEVHRPAFRISLVGRKNGFARMPSATRANSH